MELTLDIENTVTRRNDQIMMDPFEPSNTLVKVGLLTDTGEEHLVTFDHSESEPTEGGFELVQSYLDRADLLIGHNIVHDLVWLWESGFTYDKPVYDTMIAEYLNQRAVKRPLSLDACAKRYDLATQKQDTLKKYLDSGVSVRDIPLDILDEYLSHDLHATQQLRNVLNGKLSGMEAVVVLSMELCNVLAHIYRNGAKVDYDALTQVKQEFENEQKELRDDLARLTRKLMGDTPINLNSPEQLSQVIYGMRIKDKSLWASLGNPRMSKTEFNSFVKRHAEVMYRTEAYQCHDCKGTGMIQKYKKDGTPYARQNICHTCERTGFLYRDTNTKAGLQLRPLNASWLKDAGFSTGKDALSMLEAKCRDANYNLAVTFLSKMRRLNAVSSYLSNFVGGIATFTKPDTNILHVSLSQTRTSTGRLSSSKPNMQNMPRGGTFPVKRCFVSRFEGGKIIEADEAQLEFRAAAFLSQDPVAIEEVKTGFDVHSYTAKVITDAGEETSRQDAKAHTFAPLYGATGYGRTEAVAAYYTHFIEKYEGIAKWHKKLGNEALQTWKVKLPSGREYMFPDVERRMDGSPTFFTNIKNYPVQGFATADIVPLVLIEIHKRLTGMQSCLINTVHDSIVIDAHPDEVGEVLEIIEKVNHMQHDMIKERFGVDFNVPLLLESKIGDNWLSMKDA